VRVCTTCWTCAGRVHLDGGHGGAMEQRCGREEEAGALNRAARGRVTSVTEIPSWYGVLSQRAYGEGAGRTGGLCGAPRPWYDMSDGRRAALGKNSRRLRAHRMGKMRRDSVGVRPWGARWRGRRGGRRTCAASRRRARPAIFILLSTCLKLINSKNLY
jgi:hypothetical protein